MEAWVNWLRRRWVASLLVAIVFIGLHIFVLRPGYQVDDDITMISLASGYLGGKPVPFMIFSNVILGFLLNLLYRLPTNLNWEILLFVLLDFFSVWCLIYLVLSLQLKTGGKVAGILAVLMADSYFLLSITFTTIAAFAAIAGFCSFLAASYLTPGVGRRFYFFGGVLIFIAALIRIESVLLVLLSIGLSIVLMYQKFNLRHLLTACISIGLVVLAALLFNKLYVQSFPEWQAFYSYSDTRSSIQDTPRIRYQDKLKNIAPQLGWYAVDARMFTGWFIADEQIFSLNNLQYLANHLPAKESNPLGAALSYFYPHADPPDLASVSLPYVLAMIAAFLSLAVYSTLRRATLPLLALPVSVSVLFIYLIWTQKVPARVWYSFLATLVVFGFFILAWSKTASISSEPKNNMSVLITRPGSYLVVILIVLALFSGILQAFRVSATNIEKQNDYREVLMGLDSLVAQGKIQQDALIVIPAMGIPLEWSNPMTLDFPRVQVLELGWLASSPSYRDVLRRYDSYPLLTGLYQKNNVYLMSRANLLAGIVQFVQIHTGTVLQVDPIFTINYPGLDNGAYANTILYKLQQIK